MTTPPTNRQILDAKERLLDELGPHNSALLILIGELSRLGRLCAANGIDPSPDL
jgi:hypothetical protein